MYNNDPIEIIGYNGGIIKIYLDEHEPSPRKVGEVDNVSTLILLHNRYTLGDKHSYDASHYSGWKELMAKITKDYGALWIAPVYMYDHSGIALSLSRTWPFDCPWDAGMVGFILVGKNGYYVRHGDGAPITKEGIDEAIVSAKAEFDYYNDYLQGFCYGFKVKYKNQSDSVWGFIGRTHEENGLMDVAKECINQMKKDYEDGLNNRV